MKLGTKIIAAALGSVVISVVAGLIVQRNIIRKQGIELTRDTMRAAVLEAENVRESIATLNRNNAFDRAALLAEYKKSGDLRSSTLYGTVPVVAAWKAIEEVAKKEGYDFRVPKNQARNPKNQPTAEEAEILDVLESGKQEEYFKVDEKRNEIVYARPIMLTADCLACHGDPKNSATGDGKDPVGFGMENWKVGEIHGAFVLKSKLDHTDAVVAAGLKHTMMWVLPITVLIGLGFFLLNRNMIVRPLNAIIREIDSSSDQTTDAASNVSEASQKLAVGASQQAASIEETSASLEEISSMTHRNSQTVQSVKDLAVQTKTAADSGVESTHDVDKAMENIRVASNEMCEAMNGIKNASADVSKIIKTIDEIAFQTNLLALNAAVEAARAGEAGAGFAVVADEVRSLAQRSAKAAKETADMIDASIKKSEDGVRVTEKVTKAVEEVAGRSKELESKLADILHKVEQVDNQLVQISTASQEQSQGIGQINTAVTQVDKVTQSNAASAEEIAASSEELSAQATVLRGTVNHLRNLVGGEGQQPAAPIDSAKEPSPKKTGGIIPKAKLRAKSPIITADAATIPLPPAAPGFRKVSGDMDSPIPQLAGSAKGGFKDF